MAQPEFRVACGVAAGIMLFLTCFALAFSPGQLAHAEENRSTGPRIATTVFVLFLVLGNYWLQKLFINVEIRFVIQWLCFYFLCIPLALFVSEPERLGRRVTSKLKRFGLFAIFVSPWLPGGGRGMIFAILHVAFLFLAGPFLDPAWSAAPSPAPAGGMMSFFAVGSHDAYLGFQATAFYILIFLGLGPALFSRWTDQALSRVFSGLSVPIFAIVAFFAMTLVRATKTGIFDPEEHWANPFIVPQEVFTSSGSSSLTPVVGITVGGFLIVLALNGSRIIRGLLEVGRASTGQRTAAPTLPESTEGANA